MRAAVELPECVGLSRDELLLSEGQGIAEHGVPVDRERLFPIGSVTNPFTSAAIMTLAEAHQLWIDEELVV